MTEPHSTPPGWYPDPATGSQRWWDGTSWGPFAPPTPQPVPHQTWSGVSRTRPTEERDWAMWSHLGPLLVIVGAGLISAGALSIFAFVFPLVVMNTVGGRSEQVRAHAAESLNFQLSMLIYWVVLLVVGLGVAVATLGFGLLAVIPVVLGLAVFELVVMIIAAVQASNGGFFRYPLSIRFVS